MLRRLVFVCSLVLELAWLGTACGSESSDSTHINRRYDGYRLAEVTPTTREHVEYLLRLQRNEVETRIPPIPSVDFWNDPTRVGVAVDMMVSEKHHDKVWAQFDKRGIQYEIKSHDVQELLDKIKVRKTKREEVESLDLDDFNQLDDIYRWLDEMVEKCPEGFHCEVHSLGNSYEGRPIKIFKLTKPGAERRAYWIDATIHAREWLSTATGLHILNHLLTGTNEEVAHLIGTYDWYFVPVMNPDGYTYSHTHERFWRKSRAPNQGSSCVGTDLNRNFDFHWGTSGISHNPCSEIYCGSGPASEPEVAHVQREMVRLGSNVLASLTLHAYGRMMLFPYGDQNSNGTCIRSETHKAMMYVANTGADAIKKEYGSTWIRGSSCEAIYSTSGSSMDYAQGVAGVAYPYCFEVPGRSFVVSQADIRVSFQEVWLGMTTMLKVIEQLEGTG
jgi:carboxypeptidase A2